MLSLGENTVSRVATAAVLETLESWGRDVSGLDDGVGLTLSELRSSYGRIPWNDFARFFGNVRALLGSDAMLEELGHAAVNAPSWTLPAQIARMVVSPGQFFVFGNGVAARVLFSCLESELRDLGDSRFELTIVIPHVLRPAPEFFRVMVGQFRALPRALRLPDAIVEHEIEPGRARFMITMPPSQTVFRRAEHALRGLISAPAVYQDLASLRRELEKRHREHSRVQRDLERLLDSLPDGVAIHRDGILLYVNPAFARMLGYDRSDALIGRACLELAPESGHTRILARVAQSDTSPDRPMEVEVMRRDGGKVIASIEPGQDIDLAGKPAQLVVIRDLTQSRRQEELLLQAERMASLGTLAAGVAHEINNPLAWLHTSLSVLQKELARLGDDEAVDDVKLSRMQSAFDAALEGSERVRGIVQDLRTFSRPDDDSVELVDVREILRGAIRVSGKEIERHARLVEDYRDVHHVLGSSVRLGQVFLNLMVNAAQAVSKSVDSDNVIRVCTYEVDATVVVEVSDSGPGIPAHLLPRIFEPFFTTKHGEGTGLGLAISHRIVDRLGGQLLVESELGRGTTFRVVLPAAIAERDVASSRIERSGPER